MLVRLAVSGLLVELARGQIFQPPPPPPGRVFCGVTTPDQSAFATANSHPVSCNDASTGASLTSTLWHAVGDACEGSVPAEYLHGHGEHNYGEDATLEDCQRDLCEATAECTQAIETWGNTLSDCNPMDNYLLAGFKAIAWRDACVGARPSWTGAASFQPCTARPSGTDRAPRMCRGLQLRAARRCTAAARCDDSRGGPDVLRHAAAGGQQLRHDGDARRHVHVEHHFRSGSLGVLRGQLAHLFDLSYLHDPAVHGAG